MAEVAASAHAALLGVLERHGRSLEGVHEETDSLLDEQPVLASCYAASAGDVQLPGAAPGAKTAKLVRPVRLVPSPSEALAEVGGVPRGEVVRGEADASPRSCTTSARTTSAP